MIILVEERVDALESVEAPVDAVLSAEWSFGEAEDSVGGEVGLPVVFVVYSGALMFASSRFASWIYSRQKIMKKVKINLILNNQAEDSALF